MEIEEELKLLGFYKKMPPVWVYQFELLEQIKDEDFLEWLQYVYLPNCKNARMSSVNSRIALQAKKYWIEDWQKGKLLQLLIELDALI